MKPKHYMIEVDVWIIGTVEKPTIWNLMRAYLFREGVKRINLFHKYFKV